MTVKGEIVSKLLTRFPKAAILTLAKKAYKENKKVFSNLEDARAAVRYRVGQMENKKGGKKYGVRDKTHLREKTYNTNPYNLPESHAEAFTPYVINQSSTLIISDLHFPYQDNEAITTALNYGKEKNVTCILINGDLLDFAGISRHERDWRQRTVFEEFEAVRSFLRTLRENFPKAKIVFKEGNHDERWEKWLYIKAPELFDDPEYKLEVRLRLAELKIDIVKDRRPVKIGKLTVLHGHEFAGGGSGGINPARGAFLKTLDTVLIGHYHKRSGHDETSLNGDYIAASSVGCLCGLHPQFARINKWTHGFAICNLNVKTGEFLLDNLKIIKGKVY